MIKGGRGKKKDFPLFFAYECKKTLALSFNPCIILHASKRLAIKQEGFKMTTAIFRVGFQSFLISAQNAQKVFEILDGTAIDLDYYNSEDAAKYECTQGYAMRPAGRQNIHCEFITREDKDAQQDRYTARVRYEMRRELEREEEAAA